MTAFDGYLTDDDGLWNDGGPEETIDGMDDDRDPGEFYGEMNDD